MKAKVVRRAPYIIAVATKTIAQVQFVKEIEDQGVTRREFRVRPHDATRYTTKKAALQVCKLVSKDNHPMPFTMDYAMGLMAVVALSPQDSHVAH